MKMLNLKNHKIKGLQKTLHYKSKYYEKTYLKTEFN